MLVSFILVLIWPRYWFAATQAGISFGLAAPVALYVLDDAALILTACTSVGALNLVLLSSIVFVRRRFRRKPEATAAK
jgi:hypothetical protein